MSVKTFKKYSQRRMPRARSLCKYIALKSPKCSLFWKSHSRSWSSTNKKSKEAHRIKQKIMKSQLEFNDLQDETSMIVKWESLKSIPLIILLTSCLMIGVISRSAIINFILKMTPNRPISFNILVDQMIELPCFVIMTSLQLSTLITSKSVDSVFGTIGCTTFWISTVLHNASMSAGGCGIAIYRLICIKDLGLGLNIKR